MVVCIFLPSKMVVLLLLTTKFYLTNTHNLESVYINLSFERNFCMSKKDGITRMQHFLSYFAEKGVSVESLAKEPT